MDFKEYCYSKNEFPEEYKSFSIFFESWRDFFVFVTKYNDDSKRKISTEATLSYLIIASFMREIQDCLDGLSILAKEYSTKNMVPLLRKLFELYIQVIYIMKDDSESKALVYELKYFMIYFFNKKETEDYKRELENLKNKICKDDETRKLFENVYKKILAKPAAEWYSIYENIKNNEKKRLNIRHLCSDVKTKKYDTEFLYNNFYNFSSKNLHGFLSRKNIVAIDDMNIYEGYRYPFNIEYIIKLTMLFCMHLMDIYVRYYNISNEDFSNKEKMIFEDIVVLENKIIKAYKNFHDTYKKAPK